MKENKITLNFYNSVLFAQEPISTIWMLIAMLAIGICFVQVVLFCSVRLKKILILSNAQTMPLQIFHDLNSNKVHYCGN